ncbi:MAG: protein phosphatase 2C domain-containing protein [Prevotella sp.]|nr:protein phosphatase 2C domain-containing protein [Prevotella sp.]
MNIKICAISDIGKERTNNEDAVVFCADLGKADWEQKSMVEYIPLGSYGALSVVADGMGGANAGEVASSLAISTIKKRFCVENLKGVSDKEVDIHGHIRSAISAANEAIMDYVTKEPDSIGLGTTIVLLWLKKEKAYIAWCGDSRCYCFNPESGLRLMTKDHSYVQQLVDKGEIKPMEAFNHPDSNIITRCLGDVDAESEPDILTYTVNGGDIFLLCSDGLCGYCRDSQIRKELYKHFDNLEICQENLLRLALDTGGEDNITISLCATLPNDEIVPKKGNNKINRFIRAMFKK